MITFLGETVSLVVTKEEIVLAENLFPWLLLSQASNLNIRVRCPIQDIIGMVRSLLYEYVTSYREWG